LNTLDIADFKRDSRIQLDKQLQSSTHKVIVDLTIDSKAKKLFSSDGHQPALADAILAQPIPPTWEPRLTPTGDVYLHELTTRRCTPALWHDVRPPEFQNAAIVTLPMDWTPAIVEGQPAYLNKKTNTGTISPPPHEGSSPRYLSQSVKPWTDAVFRRYFDQDFIRRQGWDDEPVRPPQTFSIRSSAAQSSSFVRSPSQAHSVSSSQARSRSLRSTLRDQLREQLGV